MYNMLSLLRAVLANHVLIIISELGSKVSKIVTTKTCHHCFSSDKREHTSLIYGGNELHFCTIMQFYFVF